MLPKPIHILSMLILFALILGMAVLWFNKFILNREETARDIAAYMETATVTPTYTSTPASTSTPTMTPDNPATVEVGVQETYEAATATSSIQTVTAPTPTPTATPNVKATIEVYLTSTAAPAATLTAAAPTPPPDAIVALGSDATSRLNMHAGTNLDNRGDIIDSILNNTELDVLGRSADGELLHVAITYEGWVDASRTKININPAELPVHGSVQIGPVSNQTSNTPTPAPVSNNAPTPTPTPTLAASPIIQSPTGQETIVINIPRLEWTWERGLKDNEYFEVRILYIESTGIPVVLDTGLVRQFNLDLGLYNKKPEREGNYRWTVQVVEATKLRDKGWGEANQLDAPRVWDGDIVRPVSELSQPGEFFYTP